MKTVLSLVLVVLMAGFVMAQPPQHGGRFGAGKGKFGDPAKMAEMRQKMMERWQADKPEVAKRPGPPPWAGQGMRRGPRGPQTPFPGRGFEGRSGPQRPDFRRGGSKFEVPNYHRGYRGQGWQYRGHKPEVKWGGPKKQNHRGHHKGRNGKESCGRKDCPRK